MWWEGQAAWGLWGAHKGSFEPRFAANGAGADAAEEPQVEATHVAPADENVRVVGSEGSAEGQRAESQMEAVAAHPADADVGQDVGQVVEQRDLTGQAVVVLAEHDPAGGSAQEADAEGEEQGVPAEEEGGPAADSDLVALERAAHEAEQRRINRRRMFLQPELGAEPAEHPLAAAVGTITMQDATCVTLPLSVRVCIKY